jgi:chromosome segregation ATPase
VCVCVCVYRRIAVSQERHTIAAERTAMSKARDDALREEVAARERLVELEGRVAKATAQHEADLRYCKEMKSTLQDESRKLASERDQLEEEKRQFAAETARVMQLGLATQQKAAETAGLQADATHHQAAAERLREEVGQLRRAMESQRRDVEHRQRTLADAQRAFEEERVRIAEERAAAAAERTAAAQAAEAARAMQLKLAEKVRQLAHAQGAAESMSNLLLDVGGHPVAHAEGNAAANVKPRQAPPVAATGKPKEGMAARHRSALSTIRSTLQEVGIDFAAVQVRPLSSKKSLSLIPPPSLFHWSLHPLRTVACDPTHFPQMLLSPPSPVQQDVRL